MKIFWQSLKMILFMALVTGFIYPLILLFIANLTMPWKAQGSLLQKDDITIGSKLIGQKFTSNSYFWGRPSAVDYATLPARASNLGPTSARLKEIIQQRRFNLAQIHNIRDLSLVPIEMICSSGSGIDPHISLHAAYFQLERVANARSISTSDENLMQKMQELIESSLDKPAGRFFGVPQVNVLMLNLALDDLEAQNSP